MSGGVDSTAAAILMQREGYDCACALMTLRPGEETGEADARRAAKQLGLPFFVFDFSEAFEERVINRFVSAYNEGRTPNPCVDCNKHIKFGELLQKSLELGNNCLATGHYARVERGADARFLLKKGADAAKDQSYVLYSLTQQQLAHIHFPLGGLSKTQVRLLVSDAGLQNADKSESQDICFVPDGDYAGFIIMHTGIQPRKGQFVDTEGNTLGENRGIVRYTIGQRRGLGLSMPYPPYVLALRPEDDTVVVGKNEMLYSKRLYARDINLIPFDNLNSPVKARVKIRYKHTEQPAMVHQTGEDTLLIEFDEPQRAITGGQAAVIYDGDIVIGGGTIQ